MKFLILFALVSSGLAKAQTSSEVQALTKRIEDLERAQEELILSQGKESSQVNSFLRDDLTLGGFFESSFTALDGPDTKFMAMHSGSTMGLNISAEFTEKLRFVNQTWTFLQYPLLNPQNDSRTNPETRRYGSATFGSIVTAGYLEFAITPDTVIQTGVGFVPFGYAAQQRELVLFIRRGGPQILRTTQLFSPLWSGVHLAGNFRSINSGYNIYTLNPVDDEEDVAGLGGRWWMNSPNETFRFGISSQVQRFDGHMSEIAGADLRVDTERFLVTSEYAIHMTGESDDSWSAYVEPALKLKEGEYLVFVFGDYKRDSLNKTGTLPDPITVLEYGAGLNWLPTSNTRFRATVGNEDYLGSRSTNGGINRDFWYFDLSAGVAF